MIGLGTLINTLAVVVGGLIGICLKNGLKKNVQDISGDYAFDFFFGVWWYPG